MENAARRLTLLKTDWYISGMSDYDRRRLKRTAVSAYNSIRESGLRATLIDNNGELIEEGEEF